MGSMIEEGCRNVVHSATYSSQAGGVEQVIKVFFLIFIAISRGKMLAEVFIDELEEFGWHICQ